jgi:NAD(P)H-hydrate epimerase
MAEPERLIEVSQHQLRILERSGVVVEIPGGEVELPQADLIVDAMIGYSLRGSPAGEVVSLIHAANEHPAPVLSMDVPSGVNTTTGTVHGHAVRATATMTLALPKTGLAAEEAREYVGELYLADISVPPQLYAKPSLALKVGPIFAKSELLRLW